MLETGIPNLDLILGGGIPRGDVLLVTGPAGAGKTVLSLQIAFSAAARGETALYISTLSEPPARLIRHIRNLAFYDESLIGRRVFLLSIYPMVRQNLDRAVDALAAAVKEHEAKLLIVDGLMTFHDLHPGGPELRSFIYELGATLATLDCTTIVTSSGIEYVAEHEFPEFTMSDGVLDLGRANIGMQTVRTIRTNKMRGLAPLLGQHSLRIDARGITAYPRLESTVPPGDVGLSPERAPTGLAEVDALMHGGPLAGSATLIAGALGTGKTLACLHFVLEGARRGEKGLLLGFRESPAQLFDKARAFGLDLQGPVDAGLVAIVHHLPVDLGVDEIAWELFDRVDRFEPRRLALDDISDLEHVFVDERRQRGYLAALLRRLHIEGVTSLFTKEVAQVIGPELDFSGMPLAMLAESLVLLRYVEFRGELFRIISVLKMRDSDCDRSIRQYQIDEAGLHVLGKLETAEGVLTGIARLPSELRVKR